jgi:broad specificity phosphatase PhoE
LTKQPAELPHDAAQRRGHIHSQELRYRELPVIGLLRVFIVRHGETAWSLSGQHTGHTDLALAQSGEQAARKLGPALEQIAFSMVLTSPRLRARQTCELAGFGGRAQVDPDLAEWDYGAYEGKRTAAIRLDRPDWDIWRDGYPDGETPAQVSVRADRDVAHLRSLVGAVALFSHGQFARVLAARWVGLAACHGQHFAFDPASISTLGFEADDPDRPVISLWNASPAALGGVRSSRSIPC